MGFHLLAIFKFKSLLTNTPEQTSVSGSSHLCKSFLCNLWHELGLLQSGLFTVLALMEIFTDFTGHCVILRVHSHELLVEIAF